MAKGPGGFEAGRVSIKVVPNMANFRKDLMSDLRKIEKTVKIEVPVSVNTKTAKTQLKTFKQAVDRLDGRTIRINTKFNKDRDLDGFTTGLTKLGKAAEGASGGIGHMGHGMIVFVAVLVLAAPLVALIASLIAGLPSLLFAAGAGFAAVALGMDGIKAAAKVLGPLVDQLKTSLSNTFEKGLGPIFQSLKAVFPVIQTGLNQVAEGLINMTRNIADVILLPQNMEALGRILKNVAGFFSDLGPTIAVFVQSLLTLGDAGAAAFGPMSTVLFEMAAEFNKFVNQLNASGDLTKAFFGLAQVLGSLLHLFNQLFLVGVQSMGALTGPIVQLFDGLGNALVALMPALTALSSLLFTVVAEALNQLTPIITALTPSFTLLAQTIGTLLVSALQIIGPLLQIVAEILNILLVKALTALQPLIPPIVQFFQILAQMIGEFLLQAFVAIMPLFDLLVQTFIQLAQVLAPLLPVLLDLVQVIFTALLDILIQLAPEITRLAQEVLPVLIDQFAQAVPPLVDFLKSISDIIPPVVDLIGWLLDRLMPVITNLWELVADLLPDIMDIFEGALKAITGFIDIFVGLFTGDWQRMKDGIVNVTKGIWDTLQSIFTTGVRLVLDVIIGIPGSILGIFSDAGNTLFESGRSLINGFIGGIKSMFNSAKQTAKDIVASIRDFFPFSPAKVGPFSGKGYTTFSGRALMEDWAKGIESGSGAALAAVDAVTGATAGALDMNAQVTSDGFVGVSSMIQEAMAGWSVVIDRNGLAKMVNQANISNGRR
jgi:phage-related protein